MPETDQSLANTVAGNVLWIVCTISNSWQFTVIVKAILAFLLQLVLSSQLKLRLTLCLKLLCSEPPITPAAVLWLRRVFGSADIFLSHFVSEWLWCWRKLDSLTLWRSYFSVTVCVSSTVNSPFLTISVPTLSAVQYCSADAVQGLVPQCAPTLQAEGLKWSRKVGAAAFKARSTSFTAASNS